ncbi:MAG: EAL domain-containing protein [Lachnospiraceae bacterium]|nr:EAL domain-containing protein [Lachnospiraceae bacterium]
MENVVLVVDDEEVNCMLLTKILESDYQIETANDGEEALKMLQASPKKYAAIILDLIMPGMDGFTFLEHYANDEKLQNIPVIVSTGDGHQDNETHSLELGAWDFIRKPYNKKIIHFRLRNAIERSQMQIMRKLQYVEEYDSLTGLYRRDHFLKATREMFDQYPDGQYVMIRLDIAKFNLVNSFYGIERGDHFLREVSDKIRKFMAGKEHVTYGRMRADVFAICMTYTKESELMSLSSKFRDEIREIIPEFDMIPVFGFYLINDLKMEVNDMYDNAKLATKICKGNYMQNYAFYQDEMSRDIIKEQKIVNMTRPALEQEKFILYLQPKYDIQQDKYAGAEVLVRWKDTDSGIISPGEFIPIFERNGFIIKLDYYVWEHTCQMIRGWLDKGYHPNPVSVNVSRVSVYNPKLVDVICELVENYDIPPELLQLELTESAYTSNPYMIRETMKHLQEKGFTILMDDFGSGYSSLNVLKDIAVDVLKIDMKFMSDTDIPGRGENILASVVNMAKALEMPVIAEGVEKESQVEFLKNIGCEYVQGFYYAKPMPSDEYEKLVFYAG